MTDFDVEAWRRERLRRIEQRCAGLELERDQLVRLLAGVLAALFQDTYVDPAEYLQRLMDVDRDMLELGL